jgi:hypothetical protein
MPAFIHIRRHSQQHNNLFGYVNMLSVLAVSALQEFSQSAANRSHQLMVILAHAFVGLGR